MMKGLVPVYPVSVKKGVSYCSEQAISTSIAALLHATRLSLQKEREDISHTEDKHS